MCRVRHQFLLAFDRLGHSQRSKWLASILPLNQVGLKRGIDILPIRELIRQGVLFCPLSRVPATPFRSIGLGKKIESLADFLGSEDLKFKSGSHVVSDQVVGCILAGVCRS